MADYYDKDGNPISLMEWARLFEDWEYKSVGNDTVTNDRGEHHVSTVWLGADHNFFRGPRIIFETMVFCEHMPPDCDWDQEQFRYSTLEQAQEGHAMAVSGVKGLQVEGA
jgi:hypothetical protein